MYKTVRLEEIVKIAGRVGWKGYTVHDLREEGPWVIGANDITIDNRLDLSKAKHISREKYEESPEIIIELNDILIVKVGSTIGKVAIVNRDIGEACINPNSVILKNCKANPSYLYYYLTSSAGQSFLKNNSSASAQSALNQMTLKEMPIDLPDNLTQNTIAETLNDLNSKIELNNRINAELEAMAKTIYNYWFVQFEFPFDFAQGKTDKNGRRSEPAELKPYKSSGGKMVWNEELKREIPQGWGVIKFGEVVTIKNGKDHKHLNSGSYPVYGSGGVMRHVDEFLYESESILIPRKGSLGNLFYVNEPFWSVDTIFYTQMKFPQSCKYLFYTAQNFNIATMNTGTAVPSMTAGILNNLSLAFPSLDTLKLFDEILQPIYKKKDIVFKENQQLASLRDWLLPMLMNGQVKVN